ncbi:MAG: hydrogen peroxide-dependent heme synthase [Planctomycetota bacterium]
MGRPDDHNTDNSAPETIEGWFVLHDAYHLNWAAWRQCSADQRQTMIDELVAWHGDRESALERKEGDSACFQLVGHKGDLMWLHYRRSPDDLATVERSLRNLAISDYLTPAFSYVSTIEASLYEATAIAHGILGRQGITPNSDGFKQAFASELSKQRDALHDRVFRAIPAYRHICFYPMSKRRGEHVNWYDMSMDERRKVMRGHGRIGHKYINELTQVIGGSIGFDDWEWGVDLHSDNPLLFKKLIYEMRFDPASSRFAEFGSFYTGSRCASADLRSYLTLA